MALREILAKFGVQFDDAELKKGQESIAGAVDALKGLVGLAGGALTAKALFSLASGTADNAVALDKQATALRMSTENLQRFQQAAEISGSSSEALSAALEQLRMRSAKPGEALLAMSDKLTAIKDPTRRAQIGTMMLGQSYRDLEPMLAKGSKGIKGLLSDADDLGATFSKDTVEAAKSMRGELGKLTVFWGGLKTQLGASLIPIFTTFARILTPIAVSFRALTKNTQIFRAIAIATSGFAMFKFIQHTKLLTMSLRTLTSQFLKVIAPILILEDFLVFMSGGRSAFGEILDKAFGKGTADRVRASIGRIKDHVVEFFQLVQTEPKKAAAKLMEWLHFVKDPTGEWKRGFESLAGVIKFVMDLFTGGWDSAFGLVSNLWDSFIAISLGALQELNIAWLTVFGGLGRSISTMFQEMWNGIVSGAQKAVKLLAEAARAVGATDTAKQLVGAARSMDDHKVTETTSDKFEKWKVQQRIGIAESIEKPWAMKEPPPTRALPAAATRPAPPSVVNNSPNITVNLPNGTPEQTANRIANATGRAIEKKNNAATHSALVPGAG